MRYVQAEHMPIPIPIQDFNLSFQVGERIPLFQSNAEFYIGQADTPYDGKQLIAVRRVSRKKKATGWVSTDKELVFADTAHTLPGELFLARGEELLLEREDGDAYFVRLERFDRTNTIRIARSTPGLSITSKTITIEEPPKKNTTQTSRRVPPSRRTASPSPAPPPPEKPPSAPETVAPASSMAAAPQPAARQIPLVDIKSFLSFSSPETLKLTIIGGAFFLVLIITLASFTVIIVFRPRKKGPEYLHNLQTETVSSMCDADMTTVVNAMSAADGDMTGSLTGFGVTDLVQFISSIADTGILSITQDTDNTVIGRLFFNMGDIVHAEMGDVTGDEAVFEVLKLREGNFAFKKEEALDKASTVEMPTMTLLLESAKSQDEQAAEPA